MKKLMFAAAFAAFGSAFAIESANVVGYNTTVNPKSETSFLIGASFSAIDVDGVIPFSTLTSNEGFDDDDQIQTAYTDEDGLTQLYVYSYFGEWLDEDYNSVADDAGLPLGKAAWFISSSPKTLTTAGQVRRTNFNHVFTESSDLVTSAFPAPFCPNSENVSWNVSDDSQIQTAYTDEDGLTQLYVYSYFGEWLNEEYDSVPADEAVVGPGVGFWLILGDASETFSEVSPVAE